MEGGALLLCDLSTSFTALYAMVKLLHSNVAIHQKIQKWSCGEAGKNVMYNMGSRKAFMSM